MCSNREKPPVSVRDSLQEVLELTQSRDQWIESFNKLVAEFERYKIRSGEKIRELESEIDESNDRIGNMI